MPAPKFKAYVNLKGAKKPIGTPEIALESNEKDVRELAAFLLFVADEMKAHGQNFGHSHLRDRYKTWPAGATDFVVVRNPKNEK